MMAVAPAAATAKVVVALVVAAAGGPGVRRKAEFMTQKLKVEMIAEYAMELQT